MQQRVLPLNLFQWKLIAGVGKLVDEGLCRIANSDVSFKSAMFTKQHDIVCIVALQVAIDIAPATTFQMVLEDFNGGTRRHS